MLRQIQQRTEEISQIITDLMSFAKPALPEKRNVTLEQLFTKAFEKTCRQNQLESLETEMTIDPGESVYVDVHQITEALACLFSNAIQSYPGQNGPIWINFANTDSANAVLLTIRDKGCGMAPDIVQKAFQPFFSHRPAGRRRGMGLAHAQRLLSSTMPRFVLKVAPGQGTTVWFSCPKV
jgi:signal transduction histidine kinase